MGTNLTKLKEMEIKGRHFMELEQGDRQTIVKTTMLEGREKAQAEALLRQT